MLKNGGDGRTVFKLDLSKGCNNRCQVCYQQGQPDAGALTLSGAKQLLSEHRKARDLLILSGGEPTLWEGLPQLISFARKELNFHHIQLETNARLFSSRQYADLLVKLLNNTRPDVPERFFYLHSDFSFRVNVFSHRPEIHDEITTAAGSWKQTIRGIKNLLERGQPIFSNTVINALNYKDLSGISDFLLELGIRDQEFSFIHGEGEEFGRLAVPYSDLEKHLKKLFNKNTDRLIMIENVPYCFLEGHEQIMSDNYYSPGKDHRLKYYAYPGVLKTQEYDRVPCEHRAGCRYEFICRGVDPQYIEKFGWDSIAATPPVEKSEALAGKAVDVLKKTRCDALVFLSGGIDSKCSGAIFARENPDKKIVLVTYDNRCVFPDPGVTGAVAQDLVSAYSNILDHVFLQSPRGLIQEELLNKISHWQEVKGINTGCHLCLMTSVSMVVDLVKKADARPKEFIFGFRQGSNYPKIFLEYLKLFLAQYEITLRLPVWGLKNKTDVEDALRKFGLKTDSHQPLCLLTDVRFSDNKGDVNNPVGYDLFEDFHEDGPSQKTLRVSQEPFFESFSQLLEQKWSVRKIREL